LGNDISLPNTVSVTYNDGSEKSVDVTWNQDQINQAIEKGAGTYVIDGEVEDGHPVTANLSIETENFVKNPSFEDSDTSMWELHFPETIEPHAQVKEQPSDSKTGDNSVHFYSENPIDFELTQTITGLEPGYYTLSAFIQGGDAGNPDMQLFAISNEEDYHSELY